MSLLIIPIVKSSLVISAKDIIRVEALSNYSRIYFADGKKLVVAKILNWFDESLPKEMFARVHRSHLVNKYFIHQINYASTKSLLLHNGEIIRVSRRKKNSIIFG